MVSALVDNYSWNSRPSESTHPLHQFVAGTTQDLQATNAVITAVTSSFKYRNVYSTSAFLHLQDFPSDAVRGLGQRSLSPHTNEGTITDQDQSRNHTAKADCY